MTTETKNLLIAPPPNTYTHTYNALGIVAVVYTDDCKNVSERYISTNQIHMD